MLPPLASFYSCRLGFQQEIPDAQCQVLTQQTQGDHIKCSYPELSPAGGGRPFFCVVLFYVEADGTGRSGGDLDEAQGEAEYEHRTTRELQPDAAAGDSPDLYSSTWGVARPVCSPCVP